MKIYILTISLFVFSSFGFSQHKPIPFYIDKENKIILEYTIKGERVKLFFDTGSALNYIDLKLSDKLNFIPHNSNTESTIPLAGNRTLNIILPDGLFKGDGVFNVGWVLTDMSKTRKLLNLGDDVDGEVGFDFWQDKHIVEFDFKNKQLSFWDSLPLNYLSNKKVEKVILYKPSQSRETIGSKTLTAPISIRGSLTVADSIQLNPFFVFDTGSRWHTAMLVYDSVLLKKMISFKKMTIEEHGNKYPTTRLQLPELGIDSLYINLPVIKESYDEYNGAGEFGNYKIGGLLGMDFFLQYERVLFDCKNRIGYFIKKQK